MTEGRIEVDELKGTLPVVFVGHGSPMNAIADNRWSRAFRALGEALPRPKSILVVSAHWYGPGVRVTANERPPTIHDFVGFPAELFAIQYPAPGDVELAAGVRRLLGEDRVAPSLDWGIDHGAWSVLRHVRPAADCPVVQLSLDARLEPAAHLALGRLLAPLRGEGVLILASGNITHNLRHAMASYQRGETATPPWAATFDTEAARALEQHDDAHLIRALDTEAGRLCHPTPDHYLPLLYAAGAAGAVDEVSFPVAGFDLASLSMRAVRFG
jgi:4,5-DOPA dioxygenase extradiol